MRWRIAKSQCHGTVAVPASKSHSMRALLFAALSSGRCCIEGLLDSPDVTQMLAACRSLGAQITTAGQKLYIDGVQGAPRFYEGAVIHAGNSGQVLRFMAAVAALSSSRVALTADAATCRQRPVKPLLQGLRQLGGHALSLAGDDRAPIEICGPIRPGLLMLDGSDSQPVSALLMAAAHLSGTTTLHVQNPGEKPWVALTLHWLRRFNIPYTNDQFSTLSVTGRGPVAPFVYRVAGDWSSAAFPLVAALTTRGQVTVEGVDPADIQGDKRICSLLQAFGAKLTLDDKSATASCDGSLNGLTLDINDCIDALPILAVVGCFARGETRLVNAAIARHKESDRIACMAKELRKMGAEIQELPDGLIIRPARLRGASLSAYADHRIAMALAVAALGAEGESLIEGVECVAKSYPDFVRAMQGIGAEIECEN